MPPDFLNSREDAILVWTLVVLGYAFSKDPRGIGTSFLAVVRAALHPKLVLLYGSAVAYSALLVLGASRIGLWHMSALKASLYWFVGTAVILIADAIVRAAPHDGESVRHVLRRVFGVTILTEFILNVYALQLGYELVLVLLAFLFVGMQVVVEHTPSTDPRVRTVIDVVIVGVALIYLVHFVVGVLADLDGFLTREKAEDFLVGPVLSVALIPFLYASAWVSRRDQLGPTNSARVTRADFGEAWPFTLEQGVLRGRGWGGVTFKAKGTEYAVNGVAKGQGFKDVEEIWADDPDTGFKKNIGPIVARGLELCDR